LLCLLTLHFGHEPEPRVSHVHDPYVRVLHFSFWVLSLNVLSQFISPHSQFRPRRSPTSSTPQMAVRREQAPLRLAVGWDVIPSAPPGDLQGRHRLPASAAH
jgi:hypothetical protein